MGALKEQYQTTTEFQIVENVLYECGFVSLSDKKLFIKQIETTGTYLKITHTEMKSIKHLITIMGMNTFSRYNPKELKEQCAKINNRLLAKYNEISQ